MTTILTFIIPALIVVLLSLPLVNVFKGKVTAKSAKMRLGTHICGFFGAVALVLFLTYANSPVLAAGADKMTGSIAQGLGFIGAALATVLAQLVSVVVSVFVIRRQNLPVSFSLQQCRIYGKELKRILNIGLPIALQETTVQISFLVINSIINDMGLMQSAGYGVAQKIVSFIMLIPSAIMQSVSAFVAQNIGAGQRARAKKGFFTAVFTGCSVGVVIFFAGFFGGGVLSSIFTSDAAVIAQSADYLRGFSVECILTCVLFSSIGYFNGCGKSLPVMVQGITSAFLIRIPVSVYMSKLPNTSLMLVGLATPITTIYGILFFGICFAWLAYRRKNPVDKHIENSI